MLRSCRRSLAILCFGCWALGPAVGAALAAHELEHHGIEPRDHSHAAAAAEAFLHGHVHQDDADDHAHELAPPSFTPLRRGQQVRFVPAAVSPAGPQVVAEGISGPAGLSPEPTALDPPDSFRLCVLRL